jgi:hypothetical protein
MPASDKMTFEEWLKENYIRDYPSEDYDYQGAYEAGFQRMPIIPFSPEYGHFYDTYKLPGHKTFSDESVYAKPPLRFGTWEEDTYIPYEQMIRKKALQNLNW